MTSTGPSMRGSSGACHDHGDFQQAVGLGLRPVISQSSQTRFWSDLESTGGTGLLASDMGRIVADGLNSRPHAYLRRFFALLPSPRLCRCALCRAAAQILAASRQIRHVAATAMRARAFAARISLAAHQKAADYTIAKARLGLLEMALGAAVLLGWTLLGGLDALNQALLGGWAAAWCSNWHCWERLSLISAA
jgi:hypothetical protein